jgi:hypothetical protein
VKLPRFGSAETEKPGILDADGNIRDLSVRVATQLDVEAMSTLLVANSAEHGGQLYGNWSVGDVKKWIDSNVLTLLAVSDRALLGVLFASEKWQASAPVALATLKAWPGGNDAYLYGPVCIAQEARAGACCKRSIASLSAGDQGARQSYSLGGATFLHFVLMRSLG